MRELSLSWGHFPITISSAEVRLTSLSLYYQLHISKPFTMGWRRLRHGRRNISCPHAAPLAPCPAPLGPAAAGAGPGCGERSDLVLAAPAGVVQVVVAPVVVGPVLGLLIQPVELVGAALHVILQRVQVLLPLLGAGLRRGTGTARPKAPPCGSPRATPTRGRSRRALPQDPWGSYQQLLVSGLEVAHVFLEEEQGKG